jgi:hypothetical protein
MGSRATLGKRVVVVVFACGVFAPSELHLPALLEYVPAGHEAHTAEDTAPGTATRHDLNQSLKT